MIILFIILYHRVDIKFGKRREEGGKKEKEEKRKKKKKREISEINYIGMIYKIIDGTRREKRGRKDKEK